MPSDTGSVVSSEMKYSMSAGEALRQVGHRRLDLGDNVERVRARNLEHGHHSSRLAVVAADGVIEHRAELEAGHVFQPHF